MKLGSYRRESKIKTITVRMPSNCTLINIMHKSPVKISEL